MAEVLKVTADGIAVGWHEPRRWLLLLRCLTRVNADSGHIRHGSRRSSIETR